MKSNVGFSDRLIRFVAIDLLLGISYLGTEGEPVMLATIAFGLCLIIAPPIITGYSLLYQILGISTREIKVDKAT